MELDRRIAPTRCCLAVIAMGLALVGCSSDVIIEPNAPDRPQTTTSAAPSTTTATTTATTTTTSPPIEFAGLTVAAVGDWFADDPAKDRYVEDAEQTRDAIIEAAPALLLGLGDYTYEGTSPEGFLAFIEPLEAVVPIYPAWGNHDGISDGEVTRPRFYHALRERFAVSAEWYSFDVGPIHFVSINSEYPAGTEGFEAQFAELSEDLAAAFADDEVQVIIPFFHRAMANPVSPNGPDPTLQEFVHPLLDQYRDKIPLALQAHHHIYIRTHAIGYSTTRDTDRCRETDQGLLCEALHSILDRGTGTSPVSYGPDGIVFVTVGTGGAYATGLTPERPFVAVRIKPVSSLENDPAAGTFGYLHLTVDEDVTFIEGEYRANNGAVLDWFRIELS